MARTYGKAQDLIDFTRASSGTALRRVKYGAELVTNGTFDSADGWSVPSGWVIGSGVATGSAVSASLIFDAVNPTAGKIYLVEFDCTRTNGTIYVTVGGNFSGQYSSSQSKRHSIAIIAGSTAARGVEFYGGTFTGTIDNVSVKEVTFDTSDGDLLLFNHPNNIPRIEYDANGNLLGLLVEESRTNLVEKSEYRGDPTGWEFGTRITIVGTTTAPDGTETAIVTQGDGSGGSIYIKENVNLSANTTYTASLWAKRVAGTASVERNLISFNYSNGVGTTTRATVGLNQLTSEWTRYTVTFNNVEAITGYFYVHADSIVADEQVATWGLQVEAASFPTSYIPTSGSTATRSADVASLSIGAFGYRQDEGTVVVDASTSSIDVARYIVLWGGGTGDGGYLSLASDGDQAYLATYNGDASNLYTPKASVGNTDGKLASGFGSGGNTFAYNGAVIDSTTSALVNPQNVSLMYIGKFNTSTQLLNGYIKSIKYYPRRLTNDQLVELTS